jgi:hypothetical protein
MCAITTVLVITAGFRVRSVSSVRWLGRLLVPATLGLTSRGQGARLGPLGWACARLWAGLAEVRDACEVLARFFRGH